MSSGAPSSHEITQMLQAWSQGDAEGLEKLTQLVYGELRRLARRHLSLEQPGHTLQATALVNEAYLRLIDVKTAQYRDRAHFFALCATLMRRILVDFARTRRSQKRGGPLRALSLDESAIVAPSRSAEVLALDEALENLNAVDPRKARIIELRFFGGLTVEETAEVLNVAPSTVYHDCDLAKLWLLRYLSNESP